MNKVSKILHVVQHWARHGTEISRLKEDAATWREDPSTFCGTTNRRQHSDLISFYFHEYERIENEPKLNQLRRRIILVNTFNAIRKEEQHLRSAKKSKERIGKQIDSSSMQVASYRSKGINAIAQHVWGSQKLSPDEHKRRRGKLARMSRYGEKWNFIKPSGLILGLRGNSQR